MENKKKAAAIATVKAIIEQAQTEQVLNNPSQFISEPSAWTQWGKQLIMANRNAIQMKLNSKR